MEIGKHENVKIIGCGTGESGGDKKTPYFTLEFENQDGDSIESIHYLTEKTKARNLELLAKLGFKGKRLSDLSNPKFKISDLFGEADDVVSITVKEEQIIKNDEPQWKDEAQTVPKMRKIVEWVNVGEPAGLSKFDHEQSVAKFKELPYDADLMDIMKNRKKAAPKAKTETKKEEPKQSEDTFADDDVPF